ncbi:MAG: type III pantothenate kinase [Saprospiraceae bacterium]|nr:type III pantothenate kinase [Saprospiraceae bacterium]
MTYCLCIDIGNSLEKLAVFSPNRMVFKLSKPAITLSQYKSVFKKYPIGFSILSQVKPVKLGVKNYLKKQSQYLEMSPELRLPVVNRYHTPSTLGKDRLAAVSGAVRLYPGNPLLVIGIGTCITYDFVRVDSTYVGGTISPGLDMRLKSMHQFTAGLPLVEINLKASWTGKTTRDAMQSGAFWGMFMELEGIITRYRKDNKGLRVVLSGGGADFYKNKLKKPIFAHPNLVLRGLKEILLLNVSNS